MVINTANSVAYHGISLSIPRPTKGPTATLPIPIKPKKPITSLKDTVKQHRNQKQKITLRGVMIRGSTKKERQRNPEIAEAGT